MDKKNAVVLLSGGLDSVTTLAIACSSGFTVFALSVEYGQRHVAELRAAARAARAIGVARHHTMSVDLRGIGGSALTSDISVPEGRTPAEMNSGIPVTYVPARNTVLLACALAYAESVGAQHIFIGVNALDYAGYPDCRPEFISAFEALANLGTKAGVSGGHGIQLHAPLIHSTKSEIIRRGLQLNVDYANSSTCYQPTADELACGRCDACQLRLAGFAEVGIADPVAYASPAEG